MKIRNGKQTWKSYQRLLKAQLIPVAIRCHAFEARFRRHPLIISFGLDDQGQAEILNPLQKRQPGFKPVIELGEQASLELFLISLQRGIELHRLLKQGLDLIQAARAAQTLGMSLGTIDRRDNVLHTIHLLKV